MECLDDIWSVEEDSETSDRSDMESENTCKESDTSCMPLFEGARLTLGVSMLLVITFAMRHSITGVAFADLLLLIEAHLISPNYFGHSMKLLRDFFKKLKNPLSSTTTARFVMSTLVQKDTQNTVQTNVACKISQRKVPLPTLLLYLLLPSYSPF